MSKIVQSFWASEPILVALVGSGAVWGAVFALCAAFGHPLAPSQQTALLGLLGALGAVVGRTQVTPVAKP